MSRNAMNELQSEAAVGLIISIYRHYKTANLDQVDSMKG